MPPPHVGKSPAHIVSKNIKAGKTSDSIEYRLTGAIHQAEMPLDAGSYSTTVPVAEGYGSWAEAAGRYPQDAARLLWSRDAWLADVPALCGRAGCSGGMIGPIEKVSPPGETGWRGSAYGVESGAAQCIQPKEVSPSGGGRPFRFPILNNIPSSPQVVSFFCHVKKRSLLNASIPPKSLWLKGFRPIGAFIFYHKKANEHIVLYFINGPVPASRFLRSFREKNRKR